MKNTSTQATASTATNIVDTATTKNEREILSCEYLTWEHKAKLLKANSELEPLGMVFDTEEEDGPEFNFFGEYSPTMGSVALSLTTVLSHTGSFSQLVLDLVSEKAFEQGERACSNRIKAALGL